MEDNYDTHEYRKCVKEARRIIKEKDEHSKTASNLLSQLLYDYHSIKSIPIKKITWKEILMEYSNWVEYYEVNEAWFDKVKIILIKKLNEEQEE